jgi:hypothetical protein
MAVIKVKQNQLKNQLEVFKYKINLDQLKNQLEVFNDKVNPGQLRQSNDIAYPNKHLIGLLHSYQKMKLTNSCRTCFVHLKYRRCITFTGVGLWAAQQFPKMK